MSSGRSDPISGVPRALDGALVLFADRHEIREVVVKGCVDDPIGHGCSGAETFEVFETPSMHLRSGGDERLGTSIRPRQSKYLMARFDEFGNNG
jgi:hypothetical protein